MNVFQKYWKAVIQLLFLYVFLIFGIFWGLLFTDIFRNTTKSAWWATLLRSFSLLTVPTTFLIFWGMTLPPLPVEPDKIKDWHTQIVIRWTTRGTYPILVRDVVSKTYNNLKKYENFRLEVVTETSVEVLEYFEEITSAIYQEMVIPRNYVCPNGSLFKARGMDYGAKNTHCTRDAYILHLDEESVVNENLFLGVRQFVTKHRGYIGQGVITYANVCDSKGFFAQLQGILCHMADAMRTGDDYCRFRLSYVIGVCLVGMKGSFMLVPNEIEQTVGFDHGRHSSITEDAFFAFCNWDKLRFCRGVLEEQSPFTFRDVIKQRRRWCSGLWLVIIYHPCAWWKKFFITAQMLSWILSPLIALSFVLAFVFFQYKMPIPIAVILGYNFVMFLLQYIWGCLHQIHGSWWSKILHTLAIPFVLPFFMVLEGIGGVYGTIFPVKGFPLVLKESSNAPSSTGTRTPLQSTNDLASMHDIPLDNVIVDDVYAQPNIMQQNYNYMEEIEANTSNLVQMSPLEIVPMSVADNSVELSSMTRVDSFQEPSRQDSLEFIQPVIKRPGLMKQFNHRGNAMV